MANGFLSRRRSQKSRRVVTVGAVRGLLLPDGSVGKYFCRWECSVDTSLSVLSCLEPLEMSVVTACVRVKVKLLS